MTKIAASWLSLTMAFLFLPGHQSWAQDTERSLLWEISHDSLEQESYLFGTMHVRDQRVFQFRDEVMKAFDTCKAFAMEVSMEGDIYSGLLGMIAMPEGYSLKNHVSEEQYQEIDSKLIGELGIGLSIFGQVKPIFLYMILNYGGGGSEGEFLDEYLYNKAKGQEKQVIGIETVEEQLAALDSISLDEQIQLLMESLNKEQRADKQMEKMIKLYQKESLKKMAKAIRKESYSEKSHRALLDDRNLVMADRIGRLVSEQSTFIAIGAGHLPGDVGVIQLLRNRGFSVKAVR